MVAAKNTKKHEVKNKELLFKEEVYKIVGAAIEVHKELGNGFLKSVYEEAFAHEIRKREIPFQLQVPVEIHYKELILEKKFIIDILCYQKIIIELKHIKQLTAIDEAQILNYLKATKLKVGLLINFGSAGKLEWKRFIRSKNT